MTIKPDSDFSAPTDIEGLVVRLETWHDTLQQSQLKRRLSLEASVQVDQHLAKDLRRLHLSGNLDDAASVAEIVKVIKDWYKTAPTIHVTFSAPPSRQVKTAMVDWFHHHIDPEILIEIQVDSGIAAGFVVRTKNRLLDFTANQVLWQNRSHLGDLIRRV